MGRTKCLLDYMKALLLSYNLLPQHIAAFQSLIGKDRADRVLFITAAAVPYGLDPRPEWLDETLNDINKIADAVDEVSLEDIDAIPDDLSAYDAIFVSGGNSFYLAYRLQETDFGQTLRSYVEQGGVYVGSSAGVIILMSSIEAFAPADHPEEAPHVCPGLGLIDFALIPHADHEKYGPIMETIAAELENTGAEVVKLNDDQALVIKDEQRRIV